MNLCIPDSSFNHLLQSPMICSVSLHCHALNYAKCTHEDINLFYHWRHCTTNGQHMCDYRSSFSTHFFNQDYSV